MVFLRSVIVCVVVFLGSIFGFAQWFFALRGDVNRFCFWLFLLLLFWNGAFRELSRIVWNCAAKACTDAQNFGREAEAVKQGLNVALCEAGEKLSGREYSCFPEFA